jgi:hypothetical protein
MRSRWWMALFNFMNRSVAGLGIETSGDHNREGGTRLARIGHAGPREMLFGAGGGHAGDALPEGRSRR